MRDLPRRPHPPQRRSATPRRLRQEPDPARGDAGTARLLPCLLKGRTRGPVFVTHRRLGPGKALAERAWLTVFLLPAYSPDLNPVEWVWAHVKRSLANLAVMALDRLEALVRNRLKRLQYRPDTLDGFIAGTGPTLDTPTSRSQ
ncbi:transposase [Streptomyces sp. NPDC057592]|uniref:transposase n=1 Tax=unclassified Streptomyces TaxID=2593676 RepID=UPI00368CBC20